MAATNKAIAKQIHREGDFGALVRAGLAYRTASGWDDNEVRLNANGDVRWPAIDAELRELYLAENAGKITSHTTGGN